MSYKFRDTTSEYEVIEKKFNNKLHHTISMPIILNNLPNQNNINNDEELLTHCDLATD